MSKFKNYMNNLLAFYEEYFEYVYMHKPAKRTICEN